MKTFLPCAMITMLRSFFALHLLEQNNKVQQVLALEVGSIAFAINWILPHEHFMDAVQSLDGDLVAAQPGAV